MAVEMNRIWSALNPEGIAGAAVLAADVVAAAQDAKSTETGWMAEKFQTAVQIAAIAGGGYMIAANKSPQWGLGFFATGLVIVGANIARRVYDWIQKEEPASSSVFSMVGTRRRRQLIPQSTMSGGFSSRPISRPIAQRQMAGTRILLPGSGVPNGRTAQYSTLGDRAR